MRTLKLSRYQHVILDRVKRYPKGIKLDATDNRTALVLQSKGLIEYDDWTGIAREKK